MGPGTGPAKTSFETPPGERGQIRCRLADLLCDRVDRQLNRFGEPRTRISQALDIKHSISANVRIAVGGHTILKTSRRDSDESPVPVPLPSPQLTSITTASPTCGPWVRRRQRHRQPGHRAHLRPRRRRRHRHHHRPISSRLGTDFIRLLSYREPPRTPLPTSHTALTSKIKLEKAHFSTPRRRRACP